MTHVQEQGLAKAPAIKRGCRALIGMVVLAGGVPCTAAPAPHDSWGKAGVSAEQYRSDALDCGKQGYYLDIAQTEDAQAFVRGSRELDDATQSANTAAPGADPVEASVATANQFEQIRRSVNPERRMDHIRATMQAAGAKCVISRGYVRFALTEDQRRRLHKLAIGSADRKAYLHALASDPAVLARQGLQPANAASAATGQP